MGRILGPVMNDDSLDSPCFNVLLVDDDSSIRSSLKEYLSLYHQAPYSLLVDEASVAESAIEKLNQNCYDLIICDINLPDKDGFFILNEASKIQPDIKRALLTAYDLDNYIELAKNEKVYNIITKTAPFNFKELSAVITNLLIPEKAFGLDKYIYSDKPFKTIHLASSEDIIQAQQELKAFFLELDIENIDSLAVVIVESITNAVYHAYKNADGSNRYLKGQVIEHLPPDQQIIVTYGYDQEKLGISIRDQGGNMTPDDVLYWLERNISGQSLMDSHGRGLFLIHRLIDRVVINLSKGKSTELILLHYLNLTSVMFQDNKPLYINELQ